MKLIPFKLEIMFQKVYSVIKIMLKNYTFKKKCMLIYDHNSLFSLKSWSVFKVLVVELKNCSINDNKYNNICAYVH